MNTYFFSLILLVQLVLMSTTKTLNIHMSFVEVISSLLMLKLLIWRNHFLNFLVTIEVFMVMVYASMLCEVSHISSSSTLLFLLMVVMVAGACIGMSLLVVVTRAINKELELSLTTM